MFVFAIRKRVKIVNSCFFAHRFQGLRGNVQYFAILSSISSSICSFCSNFENACCVMFNSAARVSCLIPSISRMRFILCPWCVCS